MQNLLLLAMIFIVNSSNISTIKNMSTKLKPKRRLKKLKKTLKRTISFELQEQLDLLRSKMEESKNNDIERFKSEIMSF